MEILRGEERREDDGEEEEAGSEMEFRRSRGGIGLSLWN